MGSTLKERSKYKSEFEDFRKRLRTTIHLELVLDEVVLPLARGEDRLGVVDLLLLDVVAILGGS